MPQHPAEYQSSPPYTARRHHVGRMSSSSQSPEVEKVAVVAHCLGLSVKWENLKVEFEVLNELELLSVGLAVALSSSVPSSRCFFYAIEGALEVVATCGCHGCRDCIYVCLERRVQGEDWIV